jgi:hypothetical protein
MPIPSTGSFGVNVLLQVLPLPFTTRRRRSVAELGSPGARGKFRITASRSNDNLARHASCHVPFNPV